MASKFFNTRRKITKGFRTSIVTEGGGILIFGQPVYSLEESIANIYGSDVLITEDGTPLLDEITGKVIAYA